LETVASDSFAEFLCEQLAPLGHITIRRMFGKSGVFCDGFMFGMVRDNALYFRVDDDNRAILKEAEAFPPLMRRKARPLTSLFGAPPSDCSMNPTSWSSGRAPRWPRRSGLRSRENGRHQSRKQKPSAMKTKGRR
jgi:TfoX/Sxy family transcriptional regulator of competence genes